MLSLRTSERPAIDHAAVGDGRHRVASLGRRPEPPGGRRLGRGLLIGGVLGAACWMLLLSVVLVAPVRNAAIGAWPLAVVLAGLVTARLMVVTRR